MSDIGELERITQNRIVRLFKDKLDYKYLGDWHKREGNSHIEKDLLRHYLTEQGYDERLIAKAIEKIEKAAGDQTKNLYDINEDVYTILRYGAKVSRGVGYNDEDVWLIDWKNPENNHFAIAEEVTIKGKHTKRPDIVIYINGIALGVLELKRSIVSLSEGIRQNLDNQKDIFIKSFFSTIQLVMAGNDTQGLRYGVIETPETYYLEWKEETENEEFNNLKSLDRHLLQMCEKNRFLELLHDFIVFDGGTKKVSRHNQYFGVKASQKKLVKQEGGIIWHTQGSGKSLTMVWLAKWILANIDESRVLIVTDRKELDEQIEGVFIDAGETEIHRTHSGEDLIKQLNNKENSLICSLIHKFGRNNEEDLKDEDYEKYIEDVRKNLPDDFEPKGNIFVFIDECHRTQSGKLHKALKEILKNSIIIGFTGTPLMSKDKQKSIEVFGGYIHTYKYDEAVRDNVVLDLRYEARKIEQRITSKEKMDLRFEAKTSGLTKHAKGELRQKWATMQNLLSSKDRLEKIVYDILLDMDTRSRLSDGRGNAMLVAGSIFEACRFWKIFQNEGFKKCAVVTSFNPTIDKIKGEETGGDFPTDNIIKYDIYQEMLNGKSVEDFEKQATNTFKKQPAKMRLLIVVDKLLTGFDAPPATYLYIDKSMRNHGLFQAICRVNRLDGVDKEYGYIIDYKDLFKNLENAIDDYTSEAFQDYDKEDIEGLLSNRLEKAKERLEETLELVKALCEPIKNKTTEEYLEFFCGDTNNKEQLKKNEPKRLDLYKYVASLIRAYANIAGEISDAQVGYSKERIQEIKKDVKHYTQVRDTIKLSSGDYIDLKAYEPAMRQLIDTYISAEESEVISNFNDMSLVELIVNKGKDAIDSLPTSIKGSQQAVAETIENNLRKLLVQKESLDPAFYAKMSKILDELIKNRKSQQLEYAQYLDKIVELTKEASIGNVGNVPDSIKDSAAMTALYDNLGEDEKIAIEMHEAIQSTKKADFRGNPMKMKEIRIEIKKVLKKYEKNDEQTIDEVYKIVNAQPEY